MVAAVLVSFFVQREDSIQRDRERAQSQTNACIASSKRAAINAAGWDALSQRVGGRGNKGDRESAERYQATSVGTVATIPAPKLVGNRSRLIYYDVMDTGTGVKIVLTPTALRLQREGCQDFYKTR